MELHFDKDEFQVLSEILLQRDRGLIREIAHTDSRDFKRTLQHQQSIVGGLENKILSRKLDLAVDELGFLAALMSSCERELIAEIAHTDRRQFRNDLQRKAEWVTRIRDKVLQACADA